MFQQSKVDVKLCEAGEGKCFLLVNIEPEKLGIVSSGVLTLRFKEKVKYDDAQKFAKLFNENITDITYNTVDEAYQPHSK